MRFTLITPVRNAAPFIHDCLDSLLQQHGGFELEYLVYDAESTDGTSEIIAEYEQQVQSGEYPHHCQSISMRHFREPDQGMYDALAKGFAAATGDMVCWLNGDDKLFPAALSVVQQVLLQKPGVKWLTGIATSLNEAGRPKWWRLPPLYERQMIRQGLYGEGLYYIQQESTFWRREAMQHVDLQRFRELQLAGDQLLWQELAKEHELWQVQAFLGGSRQHANRLSSDKMAYMREVKSFSQTAPLPSRARGKMQQLVNLVAPVEVKKMMNAKILRLNKDGKWR